MYCGTETNALILVSKDHSWNNICWNHHCTGGGIQYLTSRVELDFLVSKLLQVGNCCRMPFLLSNQQRQSTEGCQSHVCDIAVCPVV